MKNTKLSCTNIFFFIHKDIKNFMYKYKYTRLYITIGFLLHCGWFIMFVSFNLVFNALLTTFFLMALQ
jgi:hypothetical protein